MKDTDGTGYQTQSSTNETQRSRSYSKPRKMRVLQETSQVRWISSQRRKNQVRENRSQR